MVVACVIVEPEDADDVGNVVLTDCGVSVSAEVDMSTSEGVAVDVCADANLQSFKVVSLYSMIS